MQTSGIPLDEMFAVLSNQYRRQILVALLETDELNVDTALNSGDGAAADVYVELNHNHLPKLVDVELIRWHRETDVIREGSRFEEIRPLLELFEDHAGSFPTGWP